MKKLLICFTAMSLATLCACTAPDPDITSSGPNILTPSESVAQTETKSEDMKLYPEKTPVKSDPVSDPNETWCDSKSDTGVISGDDSGIATIPQELPVQASKDPTVPTEAKEKQESSSLMQPTEKQTESNEPTKPKELPSEEVTDLEKNETIQTQPVTEPAPEPEITEPEIPEFDIQTWIDYAISYGQQLGFAYDFSATDCWDNPIIASDQSKYLERDITSRLNRYLNRGMTGFCVWTEVRADGKYDFYIGYR